MLERHHEIVAERRAKGEGDGVTGRQDLATQVQAWVDANWDLSLTVREWWLRLADAGYAYPAWPLGLGGSGATRRDAMTIAAVLARNGLIGPPVGAMAATLAAPTLLEHATEAQRTELVRPIATGEASWCQLFSEPGSGSDLASVGTRAVRDGDEWVVTGQKVWNSSADSADFGMLLARTDVDVPKHAGLTYFVIDMKQPGIEARPLQQMNGAANFCEVFLTEARVRGDRVIGDVNGGWQVAQTTLFHERNSVAGGGLPGLVMARSGSEGDLDRKVSEVLRPGDGGGQGPQEPDQGGGGAGQVDDRAGPDVRRVGRPCDPPGAGPLRLPGPGERMDDAAEWCRRREVDRRRWLHRQTDHGAHLPGVPGPLLPDRGGAGDAGGPRCPPWRATCRWSTWPARATASVAARTRSSSTSWASGPWACPGSRAADKDVPYRDLKVGTQAGR